MTISKKIGLTHKFCEDAHCRQCLKEHLDFEKLLEKLTGDYKKTDHLGKFRKWIESKVGYEAETDWGWAHPDTITEEFAERYADDFKQGLI